MYTHNLDPVLIDFGFIAIRWYSLAYIFGIIAGWWLGKKIIRHILQSTNLKFNLSDFDDLISYLIISIILGGRFTPKKNDIHNYFNRVEYRMGLSYGVGYLDLSQAVNFGDINSNYNDENLMQDITLNIGMGLPINKMSAVANIGLRYGTSINTNSSLIKEDYFTIYFSMALNEKWFNKRKIE